MDGAFILETHGEDGDTSLGISSPVSLAIEYGDFDVDIGTVIFGEIPIVGVSELGGSRSGSDVQKDNLFANLLSG